MRLKRFFPFSDIKFISWEICEFMSLLKVWQFWSYFNIRVVRNVSSGNFWVVEKLLNCQKKFSEIYFMHQEWELFLKLSELGGGVSSLLSNFKQLCDNFFFRKLPRKWSSWVQLTNLLNIPHLKKEIRELQY
jgi:hypothetical protein